MSKPELHARPLTSTECSIYIGGVVGSLLNTSNPDDVKKALELVLKDWDTKIALFQHAMNDAMEDFFAITMKKLT